MTGKFRLPGGQIIEMTEHLHKLYWDTVTWTADTPQTQQLFATPVGSEAVGHINGDRVHKSKTLADTNWLSPGRHTLHDLIIQEIYVEPISGDEENLRSLVLKLAASSGRPLIECPLSSCIRGKAYVEQMNAWHAALDRFRKEHPELYTEGFYCARNADSPHEPYGPVQPGRLSIPLMYERGFRMPVEVSSYKTVKVPTTFRVYLEGLETRLVG